jgi:hypothetical protein
MSLLLGQQHLPQHGHLLQGSQPVRTEVDRQARDHAARIWSFRARAEDEASARFARLGVRLHDVGAAMTVIRMVRSAASDEMEHAELCRDLVRHFGGQAPALAGDRVSEVAPSSLTLRERVLYEVVALSCITESLSAALLGAIVEQATDARVRETVHRVLRDEIEHGRLGWAHLSLEHGRGYGRFLADYLPAMLEGTVTDDLFRDGGDTSPDAQEALAGLGALRQRDSKAFFAATMRQVVFPGLERFGVDTSAGARWLVTKGA